MKLEATKKNLTEKLLFFILILVIVKFIRISLEVIL